VRIVSLLASATEMVATLDSLDTLVGRSHECDFPPQVRALPVVSKVQIDTETSSANIDAQIKRLASSLYPEDAALQALSVYAIDTALLEQLRPDVILTQTQCEVCAVSERDVARAVQQLTGFQPRIVSLSPRRLNDVWEDLLRVGEAIGRQAQAETLSRRYREQLEHLRKITSHQGRKPNIAVLEWLDPLMGAGNWMPELIEVAGGESAFGEEGQHSPWLSWEELQDADPDVLILSPCGYPLERTLQDIPLLQQHPAWQTLRAVQSGRVFAIDGNAYLHRSGPRLVESAYLLAKAAWGELPGMPGDNAALMRVF
jgi:iron complex transport system substrate-binding protein